MLGLNTFSFIVLLGIFTLANYVASLDKISQRKIVKLLSFSVLLLNLYLFWKSREIPVEFSTLTYFIAPFIFFFKIKKLEIWAVYASIMAGVFYYLAMVTAGGNIYGLYRPITVYTSLYCHGTLLFLGLYNLKANKYKHTQSYKLIIGLSLMVGWAIYMRPFATQTGRVFIYEVLDGVLLTSLIGDSYILFLPIYYVVLLFLIYKSTKWVFSLNVLLHKKFKYKRRVNYYKEINSN